MSQLSSHSDLYWASVTSKFILVCFCFLQPTAKTASADAIKLYSNIPFTWNYGREEAVLACLPAALWNVRKSQRYQLFSSFCRLIFDIWTSLCPCPRCLVWSLSVTSSGNILGFDSLIYFLSRPKDECFKWGQQDAGQSSQDRIWFKEVCRSANLNKFQSPYALLTGHQALPSFFILLQLLHRYCISFREA